jgi:hypothetical protein
VLNTAIEMVVTATRLRRVQLDAAVFEERTRKRGGDDE